MAKAVTIVLKHAKETKGTQQYKEPEEDRAKQKLGTIYVPKKTLKALGDENASEVKVQISIPE
jgi:hypothetical protein